MPMITSSNSSQRRLCKLPDAKLRGKFFHSDLDLENRVGIFCILSEPVTTKVRFKFRVWQEQKGMVNEESAYTVGLPWHLFGAKVRFNAGICLEKAFLFFFNRKPESLKAKPCSAVLPNIWTSGRICYGSHRPWSKSRIDRYMDDLHRNFWMGNFNKDLAPATGSVPEQMTDSDGDTFDNWESQDIQNMAMKYVKEVMGSWEKCTKEGVKIHWKEIPDYSRKPMTIEEAINRAVSWY